MTMQLVSTVTVGSGGAASILFSAIPQDATDLLLVFSTRTAIDSSTNIRLWPNSDSNNLFWRRLAGSGTTAASSNGNPNNLNLQDGTNTAGQTANTFSSGQVYFTNYTGSQNKTFSADYVYENNATGAYQNIVAGSWNNSSAITSLFLQSGAGDWAQHTTASLYKITKGSIPEVVVS
jgi:hypothetical protein